MKTDIELVETQVLIEEFKARFDEFAFIGAKYHDDSMIERHADWKSTNCHATLGLADQLKTLILHDIMDTYDAEVDDD